MTPADFVEQLANCTERLGFVDDACRWCRSRPSRGEPEHDPDCPVLRAQQVRDAARGAATTSAAMLLAAGQACVDWFDDHGGEDCHLCRPSGGKHDEECPLEATEAAPSAPAAPVSPGVGPPAESEDRELVEAVARALDADTCLAVYGVPGWETTTEQENKRARIAIDARAAHLSRTAAVAVAAPVPGPLVGDELLLRKVARAVLDDLEDRRGIKREFEAVKREWPLGYAEIQRAIGTAALRTVDAHLATRALRPAREVAHEAIFGSGNESPPFALSIDQMTLLMARVTAAIERDRAGRGT